MKIEFSVVGDIFVQCDPGVKLHLERTANGATLFVENLAAAISSEAVNEKRHVSFQWKNNGNNKIPVIKAVREAAVAYQFLPLGEAKIFVEDAAFAQKILLCNSHIAAVNFIHSVRAMGCTAEWA